MLAIQVPSLDEQDERVVDDVEAERGDRPHTLMLRWSVEHGSPVARWTIEP